MSRFEEAKATYARLGIDVEAAMATLATKPVSLHCWQGDDVMGFDQDGPLTGGIQTTGNYPGKARTPRSCMADIDQVHVPLSPAQEANQPPRQLRHLRARRSRRPRRSWSRSTSTSGSTLPRAHGMGIDFNPTFFSHPKVKDGLTLSSPDEDIRRFWVRHGRACVPHLRVLRPRDRHPLRHEHLDWRRPARTCLPTASARASATTPVHRRDSRGAA